MSPMSGWPPYTVPLGALILAILVALGINALALRLRANRDTGNLWTWTLVASTLLLALGAIFGWALELLDAPWWPSGYHPLFDQIADPLGPGAREWFGLPLAALAALAIPLGVWLLAILAKLALPLRPRRPGSPRPGSWLAGSSGLSGTRYWVALALAPPLLFLLGWHANRLGTGPLHHRAALWGTLAVAAATLIAIAFSRGRKPPETAPIAESEPPLADWVLAMRQRGFSVTTVCRLDPTDEAPSTRDPDALALIARWPLLSERRVSPELAETLAWLLAPPDRSAGRGTSRLILAADDCGQDETLALAIRLLHRRQETTTLIVVPRGLENLAARLAPWLPDPDSIRLPKAEAPFDPSALAWALDAQTLSEQLAELADNPLLIGRIGLVVWCDLDAYSGVLAANVWAVASRLHRLIGQRGRNDTRSLVFARFHQGHESSFAAFLQQMLPYQYLPENRIAIEQRRQHALAIHVLEPTAELKPADLADPGRWDPSLVAARASVEAGWPTRFEPPPALDRVKAGDFMQQRIDGHRLADRLAETPADAGARIMEIGCTDLLDLINLLSQGGRALGPLPAHHVGLLLPPGNAYAWHLLGRLAKDPSGFFALSRRLVPGAPQPAIVRRHLLLALRESEAVANELLNTFQWRDRILDPVLEELANRNQIERRDLRFLDRENRLRVETGYRSTAADYRPGPLDTLGDNLVSVVLREAGESEARLLAIDPERASIVAYPRCALRIQGRTYRVGNWPSNDASEIARRGVLHCTRTEDPVLTWRISEPRLRRSEPDPTRNRTFFSQDALDKTVVSTLYEEEVVGILELRRGPRGERQSEELLWETPIESLPFETKALMLRLLEEDVEDRPSALHSIAQALSQVLAVHVGVEEDAVRVVAAEGIRVGRRREWGIAIVDLYPNGIGLVEALDEDDGLLRDLLEHTRDWLADCPCAADAGCPRCLQSPPAIAASRYALDRQLNRREAVEVLRRVLGA